MARSESEKRRKNQDIIKRYDELKALRKYCIDYIFEHYLQKEFYLQPNTLKTIVYSRKKWIDNPDTAAA